MQRSCPAINNGCLHDRCFLSNMAKQGRKHYEKQVVDMGCSALAYHEALCCDGGLAGRDAVYRFVCNHMQQLIVHRCRDRRLARADIAAACQCCCLLQLRFLQCI